MSWIICRKSDGKAIVEVWNESTLEHINRDKYEAIPARQYLEELNAKLRTERQLREAQIVGGA